MALIEHRTSGAADGFASTFDFFNNLLIGRLRLATSCCGGGPGGGRGTKFGLRIGFTTLPVVGETTGIALGDAGAGRRIKFG